LFFVSEKDVLDYVKKNKLPFVAGKCPYAETSYRIEIRNFIAELSEKEKLNIMKNFERIYPLIEKKKDSRFNFCEICGEPSRNKICKKCELLKIK